MIDYIIGKISDLSPTRVTIENSGIGYRLEISLQTYEVLEGKDEAKVYVLEQINAREGTSVEYGFAEKSERELFEKITDVSGIGASSARMILSSMSSSEFTNAVIGEDINRIKGVKGIGLKTAQRLILELKDKLVKGCSEQSDILFSNDRNESVEEATQALIMLGFSKPNINKVIQAIIKENHYIKVEDIIKESLKRL